MKLLLGFSICFLFLVGSSNHIYAQKASVGVYPPIIEIKAWQGSQVTTSITVVNGSENEIEVSISLKGFNIKDNSMGTIEFYPEDDTPKDLRSFLQTVQLSHEDTPIKNINLYPKESKVIDLSFPVPTSSPEEYYFSVVFSTVPHESADETSSNTSAGVGSIIFTSLNERENLTPEIKEFSTSGFHSESPIRFNLEALNTGDHFKNIGGTIYIYNMFGQETGKIEIPSQIITAGASRKLGTGSNNDIFWDEKFPFGFYSAKAIVSYENAPTITKERRFIVAPLVPLLVLIGVLFFILGVIWRVLRKISLKEK